MNNAMLKTYFASVVSELQQSDIYMTVKARLCEAPKANLNGARVTIAFIDEIVDNCDKYVGLPLNADVKALANGRYGHLGHLYDARTGEYRSTQIGSFFKFEKEEFDGGAYLIGYARIMKRNKAICKAIAELFADGALKFSFEISCGEYQKLSDGTIEIDASENNFLEGAAVVSFPACEDAVALELVAECNGIADEEGEIMTDVNDTVVLEKEQTAEQSSVVAENEPDVVAEQAIDAAAIVVTESHRETDSVYGFDPETGDAVEVIQTTEVITHTSVEDEETPAVTAENPQEDVSEVDAPEEEEQPEPKDDENKTEEEIVDCNEPEEAEHLTLAELNELKKIIEQLKAEVAELVSAQKEVVIAETEPVVPNNPFIAEISTPKKYGLLDKADSTTTYTLLDKA